MAEYSLKIIDELKQTLGVLGLNRTIEALKKARETGDPIELHISFVSSLVCGHFNITIEKLKESAERQDVTYARAFIVHYLRMEFNTEWKEIKQLLNRDQSTLFRCSKLIKQLNPKLETHKVYCSKKIYFDDKIKTYRKQLKK